MDSVAAWLTTVVPGLGLPLAHLIVQVVYSAALSFAAPVGIVVAYTYMERKVIARCQDRIGPNRAGPLGLLQGFADAVKMLTQEDITPAKAERLSELACLMAGWSSDNKFALLGAFRTVAQLVTYEVPMVIAVIMVVLAAGSMQLGQIVAAQDVPFLVTLPVAFFLFLVASMAEIGRSPFDLVEAESEIVAGFHTEYSGMKFALFFIGEYMHLFAGAGFITTLFLGGWRGPGAGDGSIVGVILGWSYFAAKTTLLIFVMMWARATLPRLRIDHLLDFGWKFMTPIGLATLVAVAVALKVPGLSSPPLRWVAMLAANGAVVAVSLVVIARAARHSRSASLRGVAGLQG
jgi:NADH-quinone oxidoreductase subunit H